MTVAGQAGQAAQGAVNATTGMVGKAFNIVKNNPLKFAAATVLIAGASLAYQPALAAQVATHIATTPAATTLTGAIGNTISLTGGTVWTGLSHSGPVWQAAWGGAKTFGVGAYEFASNLPTVK